MRFVDFVLQAGPWLCGNFVHSRLELTVSGQNTIGGEHTLLALIQPADEITASYYATQLAKIRLSQNRMKHAGEILRSLILLYKNKNFYQYLIL